MINHRLTACFDMLKGLSKSRRNHKISEVPTNEKQQQQRQPPPPSSTSASSFVPSSSSSYSSSSSLGQQPYLSHQRKSYYFTRNLSTPPPTTILSDYNTSTTSTTRRCASSNVSKPPKDPSSPKKKRVAPGRRNRQSSKSDHKPSPRLVSTSVLSGCKTSVTIESLWTKPDSASQVYPNSTAETCSDNDSIVPEISSSRTLSPETLDSMLSWSSVSCSCRVDNKRQMAMDGFGPVSEFRLPSIRTNITRKSSAAKDIKDSPNYINEATKLSSVGAAVIVEEILSSSASSYVSSWKEERRTRAATATRRVFVNNSPGAGGGGRGGLKLRTNSPRIIGNKRILNQAEKSLFSSSSSSRRWSRGRGKSVSESMAVVKTSKDPQRDFRASMVEMIVENNICASKDLEDLLACYLCLNSNEYHELIVGVFREIWFDLVGVRPTNRSHPP